MLTLRPLILATGSQARLTLSGLTPNRPYRLTILPARTRPLRLEAAGNADAQGRLTWSQQIAWQGAALCDIFAGQENTPLATLHIYAAPPEIARRRPLRCDFHIHTVLSDGRSIAAEMALRGRELGLDALAITDHNQYAGSLEAIEAARQSGLGLLCFPGEEVSASDWHLLAIGASEAIGYTPELAGYAGCRATIDTIHRLGGRAYLAHPYWTVERGRHHLPSPDYERLLGEGGLDGIELFGDVDWEDNLRSLTRYIDLSPAARPPILGNSDTHRLDHTYGSYWTLVLAETATHEGILTAIAGHWSLACALMPMAPAGQPVRPRLLAAGPFDLVDLALFLDTHYFPLHDALCREEAALARRVLAGDTLPETALAQARGQLEMLYQDCWGYLENG